MKAMNNECGRRIDSYPSFTIRQKKKGNVMVLFEQSSIVKELAALTYDMWSKGWDEYNGGNVSCILRDEDLEQLPRAEPIKQVTVVSSPR